MSTFSAIFSRQKKVQQESKVSQPGSNLRNWIPLKILSPGKPTRAPKTFREACLSPMASRPRKNKEGLGDHRALLTKPGRLFKRVCHLQNAEVFLVPTNDL